MSSTTANFEYNAPTDFRIAQLPENLPPEQQAAFTQIYSAIQQIIFALVANCGIGPRNVSEWVQLAGNATTLNSGNLNRFYVQALENIPYGAAITLVNEGSTVSATLANATNNTKPARGFCSETSGITMGSVGEVQLNTGVAEIAGLTPGASYYLSTTDGIISETPATASGNIGQYVGFAIDESNFFFNTSWWLQY